MHDKNKQDISQHNTSNFLMSIMIDTPTKTNKNHWKPPKQLLKELTF